MKVPRTARASLKAAYNLIRDRKKWMQGRFTDGERFCAIGALQEVDGPYQKEAEGLLRDACHKLFNRGTVEVNDSIPVVRAHRKILRAFRLAIKRGRR